MFLSSQQLNASNKALRDRSPSAIIEWVLSLKKKTVVTTHFGPHEAAILHLVHSLAAQTPVIWVDHGYNTEATYRSAEEIAERLQLNLHCYTPRVTRRRREVVFGGVPSIDQTGAHTVFTREVKLEPFSRAFAEHRPQVWLTALRREQTEHRARLDILSVDAGTQCLKVAPFFYYSELDMEQYLVNNDLPLGDDDYNDPTKVLAGRECGLHTSG